MFTMRMPGLETPEPKRFFHHAGGCLFYSGKSY
jgi:hypothetical protein